MDRVVLSTGASFQGIKLNRKTLERKQRILGRAKKGSNSRKRKKVLLAKEWQRVRGRERNAVHRLTTEIVRKGNRIAIEDLQIGNMLKNRRLARAISEQQWGHLSYQLSYKAESAGGEFVKVDPAHSSRTCSGCGSIKDMPLSVRVYACPDCGLEMSRDRNAAINILRPGIEKVGWEMELKVLPDVAKDNGTHALSESRLHKDALDNALAS